MATEIRFEGIKIQCQVLNAPFAELHIIPPDPRGDLRLILPRQGQHLVVHIDTENLSGCTDDLGSDIADFAAARQGCLIGA